MPRRCIPRFPGLLAFVALGGCGTAGAAQQADLRVEVALVRVPFVAADANGKPIRDLRREELTVKEDGVPQEIRYLWTETDLPLTVGLVIDISSSQMGYVRTHLRSAEQFIRRVIGPDDRALLATVDEQPRLLLGLTSSTDELLSSTANLSRQHHAGELFGEPCQPPPRLAKRGTNACIGTAIWDGMFHLARTQLSHVEGRKSLILLSDGLDLNSSVHGRSSATEAAQSAGVTVYTIRYLSAPYLALSPPLLVRAVRDHGMEDAAVQTGGLAFNNPKDLDKVYGRIEEDLRSQYVLAYIAKVAAEPGAWHRLEVRATRQGVNLRAKTGYRVP